MVWVQWALLDEFEKEVIDSAANLNLSLSEIMP
jgi:hypothetical protein